MIESLQPHAAPNKAAADAFMSRNTVFRHTEVICDLEYKVLQAFTVLLSSAGSDQTSISRISTSFSQSSSSNRSNTGSGAKSSSGHDYCTSSKSSNSSGSGSYSSNIIVVAVIISTL